MGGTGVGDDGEAADSEDMGLTKAVCGKQTGERGLGLFAPTQA
jgi:hypothetical protein